MKSLFSKTVALLCAVLMAGSLTACGNKTETKETSEASASTSAVQQAVTTAAGTTDEQQTTVAETTEVQQSDSAAETAKADATDTGLVGSWEYEILVVQNGDWFVPITSSLFSTISTISPSTL